LIDLFRENLQDSLELLIPMGEKLKVNIMRSLEELDPRSILGEIS